MTWLVFIENWRLLRAHARHTVNRLRMIFGSTFQFAAYHTFIPKWYLNVRIGDPYSLSLVNIWRLSQTRMLYCAIQTAPKWTAPSVLVYTSPTKTGVVSGLPIEMSYHIGENSTVYRAETFAVEHAAELLIENGTKKTIMLNRDSQAAIQAVDSTTIKSKTTRNELHKLGQDNHVWIPDHKVYLRNEKADELQPRKGSKTTKLRAYIYRSPGQSGRTLSGRGIIGKWGRGRRTCHHTFARNGAAPTPDFSLILAKTNSGPPRSTSQDNASWTTT